MKKCYVILATLTLTNLFAGSPRSGVEVNAGVEIESDGNEDDTTIIWVGPGWYWGIWFDNEVEFDDYYHHHHYHGHDHDHHHDGHHHGGGGHHHGGGHGGGHHH